MNKSPSEDKLHLIHQILGLPVSAICMQDALDAMQHWIDQRTPNYICCVPAHTVMNVYDHPELQPIFEESGLNTPDGMAIVWLLRWAGFRQVERVYGPDLLQAACSYGLERGWRHYFYGGTPETVSGLAAKLQNQFPGLQVTGLESPPFRPLTPEEDEESCRRMMAAEADIVWVGLGSPKQEKWMHTHAGRVGAPVLVGVGAAFDFLSGAKSQAPRWVQKLGMEWLFRLVSEPRRLWKRYVLGYPRFIFLVLGQLLREKFKND